MTTEKIINFEGGEDKHTVSNPFEVAVSAAIIDKVGRLGFMSKVVLGVNSDDEEVTCVKYNTHDLSLFNGRGYIASYYNNNFEKLAKTAMKYIAY